MGIFKRRRAEFQEALADLEERLAAKNVILCSSYKDPAIIKRFSYGILSGCMFLPLDPIIDDRLRTLNLFRKKREEPGFDLKIVPWHIGLEEHPRMYGYVGKTPNFNYDAELAGRKSRMSKILSEEPLLDKELKNEQAFIAAFKLIEPKIYEHIYAGERPNKVCTSCSGSGVTSYCSGTWHYSGPVAYPPGSRVYDDYQESNCSGCGGSGRAGFDLSGLSEKEKPVAQNLIKSVETRDQLSCQMSTNSSWKLAQRRQLLKEHSTYVDLR